MKRKFLVGLAIGFLLFCAVGVSQATVLDFNDGLNLGVTLGGNMMWNGTGGGHLYMEMYDDDDFIFFLDSDTYVNSFLMNARPWEGYDDSRLNEVTDWMVDIEAFDVSDVSLWSQQVDLENYQTWDSWLTVNVETDSVSYLKFYATGNLIDDPGFWPSIDNLRINEEQRNVDPVPEPSTMLLLGAGLVGLVGSRRKLKKW